MFRSSFAALAVTASFALGATASSASTVTLEGMSSGEFTGSEGYEYTAARPERRSLTDLIRYGRSGSTDTLNQSTSGALLYNEPKNIASWGESPTDASDKSTMEIKTTTINEEIGYGTTQVVLGEIDWYNAAWMNYDDAFSLNATLDFELGDAELSQDVGFDITTTDNDLNPNADEAELIGFDDLLDGLTGLDLGDGMTLTDVTLEVTGGGYLDQNGLWVTYENQTSTLQIVGNVYREAPSPVPLPAAGWMLMAGIGGMMALKRRKAATT